MSEGVSIAFIGAGIALLIALFQEPVILFWRRIITKPALNISFNLEPPFCHKTLFNNIVPVYYFRFQVFNDGRTTAENCEALIEELFYKKSEGSYIKEKSFFPINLTWSSRKIGEELLRHINPHQRVYCDIGFITGSLEEDNRLRKQQYKEWSVNSADDNKIIFLLALPLRPFSQKNYLAPGDYKINISIYSENAKRIKRIFIISWTGNWKDNEQEMFREINIKEES